MSKLKFSVHGVETIRNFFNKKDCNRLYKSAIKKINFNDLFKTEKVLKRQKNLKM